MSDILIVTWVFVAVLLSFVGTLGLEIRKLKALTKVEHLSTREYFRDVLYLANADTKYSVALKTHVFEKYGIQLSDTDVTTMMIMWGKQLESLAAFEKFVDSYLKEKKWQLR